MANVVVLIILKGNFHGFCLKRHVYSPKMHIYQKMVISARELVLPLYICTNYTIKRQKRNTGGCLQITPDSMRTLLFVIPFMFIIPISACKTAQEMNTASLNRVILNKADTIYQFYTIRPEGHQPEAAEENYYYWYNADTILITRNGYDGKLLHGKYNAYYPNKNLKESGSFEYGLKEDEWKSWFSNGELQSVSHWRSGKKNGEFREFTPGGDKLRTGQYRNGSLSGYIVNYVKDTAANRVFYRNGEPVIENKVSDTTKKKPRHAVQK